MTTISMPDIVRNFLRESSIGYEHILHVIWSWLFLVHLCQESKCVHNLSIRVIRVQMNDKKSKQIVTVSQSDTVFKREFMHDFIHGNFPCQTLHIHHRLELVY